MRPTLRPRARIIERSPDEFRLAGRAVSIGVDAEVETGRLETGGLETGGFETALTSEADAGFASTAAVVARAGAGPAV